MALRNSLTLSAPLQSPSQSRNAVRSTELSVPPSSRTRLSSDRLSRLQNARTRKSGFAFFVMIDACFCSKRIAAKSSWRRCSWKAAHLTLGRYCSARYASRFFMRICSHDSLRSCMAGYDASRGPPVRPTGDTTRALSHHEQARTAQVRGRRRAATAGGQAPTVLSRLRPPSGCLDDRGAPTHTTPGRTTEATTTSSAAAQVRRGPSARPEGELRAATYLRRGW